MLTSFLGRLLCLVGSILNILLDLLVINGGLLQGNTETSVYW